MNKFIADAFAVIVSILHWLFIGILAISLGVLAVSALFFVANPYRVDLLTLQNIIFVGLAFLLYIIVIGSLSVYIEMHRNITKIREILEGSGNGDKANLTGFASEEQARVEPRLRE